MKPSKPGEGSVCRYNPDGGFLLRKLGENWFFIWKAEILVIDVREWGWIIYVDGERFDFEDLFEALDWWDERLKGSEG